MIVDAHQHLWDPADREYPWMTDDVAAIRRRFDRDDLAALTAAAGVHATIAVQAVHAEEETLALRRSGAPVAGVVGWTDLTAPDVLDRLAGLVAVDAPVPLVGIRHQAHDEPDADWLARPDVRRGVTAVAAAGLPFDLLIRRREHAAALELIGALPEARVVVDHAAKPPIAEDADPRVAADWRRRMTELAAHPNVVVKVSGLLSEAGADWPTRPVGRYLREAVECFGPDRAIWGSDWPVSTLVAEYADTLAVARDALADLGAGEVDAVFAGTALAVYSRARVSDAQV